MNDSFQLTPLEFDKIREIVGRFALTSMALERIAVLAPMRDRTVIERRLDDLVEMSDLLRYDDAFPIDSLKDIRGLLEKIRSLGTFLPPDQLLLVQSALETARRIKSYVHQRVQKYPKLFSYTERLRVFGAIEEAIQQAIDEQGTVKDSASARLRQLRRDKDAKSAQLRKKLETLARQFTDEGFAAEAIVTVRDGRMVIPVKDEYKNTVRGFIHDESASGQTVFIEPTEGLELNNELRKLVLDEVREVERILTVIADAIRTHYSALNEDIDIWTEIEFLYAKARLANVFNGVKPELNEEGRIDIKNGLHPLLLHKELNKRPEERRTVVPLNLAIGQDYRTLIISGPNAGGKTVAIKTLGLFVLMVQAGLLIPAAHGTRMAIFEQVFADIGDDQSIENDLSTFSSHVQHLAMMVRRVTPKTLILIDEIGSGTDPAEGSSLAIAILNHFNDRRAVSVVTTHHGELKAFAHNTPGVENGSMAFDQETLQPTYVFRPHVPGSSYAFEISKRMGLSDAIIANARTIAGTEAQQMESLIQSLQNRVHDYDQRLAALSRDRSGLDGMVKFYNDRTRELKEKEKSWKRQAVEEKQRLLSEAAKKIDQAVLEIKNAQAAREAVQAAKKTVAEERASSDAELRDLKNTTEEPPLESVRAGDRVYIRHMELDGTVLEPPDGTGQALVGVGSLKVRIDAKQLAAAKSDGSGRGSAIPERVDWETDDIGQEIDLRGLTVEEALYEVDKYLTDASVLGFSTVTLLHGKGGGILRNRINEFLKKDRRVSGFRLGQYGEGDTGVTVVELKDH